MSDDTNPAVEIADGVTMPLLGLGTWQANDREAHDAVRTALEVGYRLIDTATAYGNEAAIGRAVRDSEVPRQEVFVTTKMVPADAGHEREAIDASLSALGLDQIDLWLIHWPASGADRPETWARFIAARDDGLTRAIGVSNFSPAQIDAITEACGEVPAVNQIEWAPTLYDPATVEAHRSRGVTLEGYSPFRAGDVGSPVLAEIAGRHGVSARQVILRWHLEHGIVAIPKSADAARIAANFDVFGFALSDDEIARIDALGRA